MEGTKAAKKNQKRRAAKKTRPEDVNESDEATATRESIVPQSQEPFDPIADIKQKIEQAKAAKDHDLAQKLRQELWVLQDTVRLGRVGPGAPQVDVAAMMKPQTSQLQTPMETSSSLESTDPTEKKIGKLRKKLQQIEALKQRQADGEKLEVNQIAKIQSEPEIQEEIELLESLLRDHQLR